MDLPLTGERTLPGIAHENYWYRRHEVVYDLIVRRWLGRGQRVLDAGCGEGYGANLMRQGGAGTVVALDYDLLTAAHVRATYDLDTVRGNLVQMPFHDGVFDLLVSLQTVEHLWDQDAFVRECARVTTGAVVLATPNRLTFPPGNICHTRELTAGEFVELLAPGLNVQELLGLHHGERIRAWEREHGSIVDAQLASEPAHWPEDLAKLVADLTTADFEITPNDLDGSLDLIATATAG